MNDLFTREIREDAVIIRFNRPEIRNPLSVSVLQSLDTLLNEIDASEQLKRIILTGTDRVFASGADLREIAAVTAGASAEFALRGQNLMSRIAELPKLTVAAINGYCFGGALDLALACKKRIAVPNATFSHPGARIGIITGWGGTQRLPRLIGQANALQMFFTAEPIGAAEALRIGLVDQISVDLIEASLAA